MGTIALVRFKRAVAVVGLIMVCGLSPLIYTAIREGGAVSKNVLPEYNNLFTNEAQSKLKILATFNSTLRQTTSSYVYDQKYNVFVYKIILAKEKSLNNVVQYQNHHLSDSKAMRVTGGLPSKNFNMELSSWQTNKISGIELISSGDSIRSSVKTDDLFYYNFKFKEFALGYDNGTYDITAKADDIPVVMSIAFVKKQKFIYVILMSVDHGDGNMQPDLLYSLIDK